MSDAAAARSFVCRSCRRVFATWAARCSSCNSTAGFDREAAVAAATPVAAAVPARVPAADLDRPRLMIARAPAPFLEDPVAEITGDDDPIPLSDVPEATFVRDSTGLPPLDHVLGGGLVEASVVLLAAVPGCGKSSLTLQMLDGLGHRCLYVTGEETREQVAATARRIGAASSKIFILVESDLERIFTKARAIRARTIAIDSIQKMRSGDVPSRAGSPAQLRECTARLVQYAKTTATSIWIIGHVTADGDVAGPRTIEHDVDVVLELDRGQGREGNERILRCPGGKNRFGASNVEGRFELTDRGLVPVDADGWDQPL